MATRNKMDAWSAAQNTFSTIEALVNLYDSGQYHVSRTLATEIHRLITAELVGAGIRRTLDFKSRIVPAHPLTVARHLCVSMMQSAKPTQDGKLSLINFVPLPDDFPTATVKNMRFSAWWSEALVVDSNAGGSFFVRPEYGVPFDKRARLTRHQVVELFRNKLGAHYDMNIDEQLAFAVSSTFSAELEVEHDGQYYNTHKHPEKFQFANNIGDSCIRHISSELLSSKQSWDGP